jgi:hypothetical protein
MVSEETVDPPETTAEVVMALAPEPEMVPVEMEAPPAAPMGAV